VNPEAVLSALDPEQRAVATALHGPVCVLAGAGTGKTRAITHRIAYGVLSGAYVPQQILAVTFTTRAAGELRGRLRGLGATGVQARTFHSAALRQLQYFWPRAVGGEPPRIVDSKAALVTEAAGRSRLQLSRPELRDVAAEIEWAKVTMAAPDDYPAAAAKASRVPPAGLDPATMARVYAGYEEAKRRRGFMDLEDVLLLTVGVLEDRPDAADTVRGQYRHFVVDEYQDVSPLQQRLLDLWLGERDSVCVVGDAAQTIYSFAGATPDFLLGFARRHPASTVIRLVRDYRSTPQVVALANSLLASARGEVARQRVQLQAQHPAGPAPRFTEAPDEPAEAAGVAQRIRRLIDEGVRAAEIAVLFRTNAQSETYESALAEAGVPYVLKGAERFFDRPEVREARVLLRGAARGDVPDGGLPEQVRAVLTTTGWTPEPSAQSGAARERWESVAAVVRLAEEFAAATPGAALAEFVAELDERAAAQHVPTVEGVTLASLHAAKGLEWDAVFLVGLVEGMVPITYAETPEQIEEERRLLYVGATRAREHLALSWALARSPGGRAGRRPSRFLDGLRPSGSVAAGAWLAPAAAGGRSRRSGVPRCRVCGQPLADPVPRKLGRCESCPSNLDEELYERLRSWRLERARERSVPAYCILTDATLAAIAETKPSSERELTAIPGVGRTKLDKYGADVLDLCAAEGRTDATL
jgi:DNA helicase-2/ATP-dependent DNA helicase PcrA